MEDEDAARTTALELAHQTSFHNGKIVAEHVVADARIYLAFLRGEPRVPFAEVEPAMALPTVTAAEVKAILKPAKRGRPKKA